MKIKSYKPNEINDCREASQISATILDELFSYISEGITTEEIDNYCLERITKLGGVPAPVNGHLLCSLIYYDNIYNYFYNGVK